MIARQMWTEVKAGVGPGLADLVMAAIVWIVFLDDMGSLTAYERLLVGGFCLMFSFIVLRRRPTPL